MPGDKQEHFTRVQLIGLQGEYRKLTDREELDRIASQILPCKIDPQFEHSARIASKLSCLDGYQEFSILVEGGEAFRQFPSGLQPPEFVTLKKDGEEYAFAWYCTGDRSITPKGFEYRNFRLRIYNIAVGPAGIFDDEDGSGFGIGRKIRLGSSTHLNWHVGEIHIINPDIKPDTPRTSLELDALSRRAVEEIRSFYEDRIAESRARASFNTHRKTIETCEQKLDQPEPLDVNEARDLLNKLEEQESLLRARRPTDKVKQFIRNFLSQPGIKTKRKQLIKRLQEYDGQLVGKRSSRKSSDLEQSTVAFASGNVDGTPQEVGTAKETVDYEQLLSDIFAAIQSKVGDDPELYAEICASVQSVFEANKLLNA
jgi:hypothetical protein